MPYTGSMETGKNATMRAVAANRRVRSANMRTCQIPIGSTTIASPISVAYSTPTRVMILSGKTLLRIVGKWEKVNRPATDHRSPAAKTNAMMA